jgi:hypothetical protein
MGLGFRLLDSVAQRSPDSACWFGAKVAPLLAVKDFMLEAPGRRLALLVQFGRRAAFDAQALYLPSQLVFALAADGEIAELVFNLFRHKSIQRMTIAGSVH